MEQPDITLCTLRDSVWIVDVYACPDATRLFRAEALAMTWTEPMFMWQMLVWFAALVVTLWVLRLLWRDILWDSRFWFRAVALLFGAPIILTLTLWFMNAPYSLARHGLQLSHGESIGVCLAIWSMVMGWLFFKASQRSGGG
ncbi:hypothetical protein [uncultured Tateyamaria sp.]|uniref:hypothetical protein n=1 Tax=uncultured Tateyamaria sp. TaxID=455651 RepID=UPI0026168C42|nr:hypothetical protein [uncultured Tateyamaria sp.]